MLHGLTEHGACRPLPGQHRKKARLSDLYGSHPTGVAGVAQPNPESEVEVPVFVVLALERPQLVDGDFHRLVLGVFLALLSKLW